MFLNRSADPIRFEGEENPRKALVDVGKRVEREEDDTAADTNGH
jgi:hypothetical protein